MEPDENNIHVVEIFLLSLNRVNQEVYIWGFIVFVFGLVFLKYTFYTSRSDVTTCTVYSDTYYYVFVQYDLRLSLLDIEIES